MPVDPRRSARGRGLGRTGRCGDLVRAGTRPGLSDSFLAAVEASLVRIGEWPDAAPAVGELLGGGFVRSARVRRFPYRVVYVVHDEAVRVLAVAHTRREPRYWQGRTLSEPPDEPAVDL